MVKQDVHPWWREKDSGVHPDEYKVYEDFRNFLFIVWRHLSLPNPTPVQYDICQFLQHGPKRSIIEAFRGVGKSWVTSAFVCWVLLRDPQHKFLILSASKERADSFSIFTKRLIGELPLLEHLIPKNEQRSSNVAFDVGPASAAHAPTVKSVGIGGQITGSRADTIIADDIEVPGNSATQQLRDKLAESIKEFEAILTPKESSRIIYLGTPQSEDSIYNRLPERGYVMRVWPARYPTEQERDKYQGALAPLICDRLDRNEFNPGQSTDPQRFSDMDLEERAVSYGKAGFTLQFMLITDLSDQDKYPLKLSDLIVTNLNPEMAPAKLMWTKERDKRINDLPAVGMAGDYFHRPGWISADFFEYQGSVMAIDPSGRGKDELGYAVVKQLNSQLFVTAAGGLQGGYDNATLEKLAQIAKDQNVNYIIIESNFGDGMFTELFKPVLKLFHNCTVEEVRHHTQKEKRIIDTLEPVMSQHRLIVDADLIQMDYDNIPRERGDRAPLYRLFHQMTRLTQERASLAHDDRLDALSMAVAYWTEQIGRSVQDAVDKQKEEWLDKQLRDFVRGAKGGRASKPNWTGRLGRPEKRTKKYYPTER